MTTSPSAHPRRARVDRGALADATRRLAVVATIGAHLIVLSASLVAVGASAVALFAALAPFMA